MQEKRESIKAALEASIGFAKSAIYSAESTPGFSEVEISKYRKSHNDIIEALTTLQELEADIASEEMVEKVAKVVGEQIIQNDYVLTSNITVDEVYEVNKDAYEWLAKKAIATILGN